MVTHGRTADVQQDLAAVAPVGFALFALILVFAASNIGADRFDATVIDDTLRRDDGQTYVAVEWDDEGVTRRGEVAVNARQASQDHVRICSTITGDLMVHENGFVWPPAWLALLAGLSGALVGFVVTLVMRSRQRRGTSISPPVPGAAPHLHDQTSERTNR